MMSNNLQVNQVKQFELNRPSLLEVNNSVLNGYLSKPMLSRESNTMTFVDETPTSDGGNMTSHQCSKVSNYNLQTFFTPTVSSKKFPKLFSQQAVSKKMDQQSVKQEESFEKLTVQK
jgi:hypothetical protein